MAAEVRHIFAIDFLLIQFVIQAWIFISNYFLRLQAEASREARAKIIASEGEQKAARALREASEIIGDSPAALQLRYLQVNAEWFRLMII